jgi:DNA-binding GntR family transcriptional regulator
VAERAAPAVVAELRSLAESQLEESVHRTAGHLLRIGELNDQFHRLIQTAAESPRLAKTSAGLIEAPLILRTFGQYTAAELRRSADQHLELVQAVEARDPIWAHSVMRAHILAGRATYMRSRRAARS